MLGYIIGNGWEDTTVAYTDEKYPDMEPYKGTYLTAPKDASAFESLLAETGDRMLYYESTRYDEQRLISFSSGNATDPFDYPKKIAEYFRKCARIDTEHITATDKFISGQFASYSALHMIRITFLVWNTQHGTACLIKRLTLVTVSLLTENGILIGHI